MCKFKVVKLGFKWLTALLTNPKTRLKGPRQRQKKGCTKFFRPGCFFPKYPFRKSPRERAKLVIMSCREFEAVA